MCWCSQKRQWKADIIWYDQQVKTFYASVLECNYHLPTKLREGNIFTGVCHSVHGGPYVTITHDMMELTIEGLPHPAPPPYTETPACLPPPSCWWHLVAKTKDLFKQYVHLRIPYQCWHLVAGYWSMYRGRADSIGMYSCSNIFRQLSVADLRGAWGTRALPGVQL